MSLFRLSLCVLRRIVRAKGFLGQVIPGHGKSPCSRTGTDIPVLADPALPLEQVLISEIKEYGVISIDFEQGALSDVSTGDRQKS